MCHGRRAGRQAGGQAGLWWVSVPRPAGRQAGGRAGRPVVGECATAGGQAGRPVVGECATGKKDRGIGQTPYAVENFPYLRCPGTV